MSWVRTNGGDYEVFAFSSFLAWVFLGESLNLIQILATFVVVFSLGIIMVDQD